MVISREPHVSVLRHHRANQTEHVQSLCRHTSVLRHRAGSLEFDTSVCIFGASTMYQYGEYVCVPLVVLQDRVINHAAGSHGVSGIFMKYDISSLMVKVTEQHMPLWQFLVRLCGIIGGIFSTTGTQKKHSLSVRCSFEGPHWSFVMSVASRQLLLLITLTTVLKSI